MVTIIELADTRPDWKSYTSKWSILEVMRALRKDGKSRALIELDIRELRRHRIALLDVGDEELKQAEKLLLSYNLYASDALHAATFMAHREKEALGTILCDDRHYERLKHIVRVHRLEQIRLQG